VTAWKRTVARAADSHRNEVDVQRVFDVNSYLRVDATGGLFPAPFVRV
jgi:hypothetical protein